jgi:hypothetical protein
MNPELVIVAESAKFLLLLTALGAGVAGFLLGYLTKNFTIDKKLRELEDVLEKETGKVLDDHFDKLY